MELDHLVGAGRGLLGLPDPPPDDDRVLGGGVEEVRGADEGRAADHGARVHDGLLDVALDGPQHGRVDDAGQDPEGVGPVKVDVARHVLGEGAGDDDDVVRVAGLCHLLDEEVDHAAEAGILGHEELGDPEEDLGRLDGRQGLAGVVQVEQLGNDGAALAGILPDLHRVVEAARLLQHCRLLQVGVGET